MLLRAAWAPFAALALTFSTPALADDAPPATTEAGAQPTSPWCAPGLETLPGDVCLFEGARESARRTLVVFLHGVIRPDSGWQHNQQRGVVAGAKRLGFTLVMPRGRRGIGPPGMTDWYAWPTSTVAQREVESSILDEWERARDLLESRSGHRFDEVFVVGFSNGAYYAASLALRGRLAAQGYAVFAGGSAPDYLRKAASATKARAKIFVSIASKDPTTVRDSRRLDAALRALKWPHRTESRAVGHAIADEQLDHALAFLRAPSTAAPSARGGVRK